MQNFSSKLKSSKILKNAVDFHGHLGPWLVLGLLMGEFALKNLKTKRYFGLKVKVCGASEKPKSCLVDGLQLSTGCTYGKGNIQKINGNKIQVLFYNLRNNRSIKIYLQRDLIKRLNSLDGHKESEVYARKLLKINPSSLFELRC